jgi:diguanylate cyclase (GGDEF)-like protein/PAS domain S-box-containing protein
MLAVRNEAVLAAIPDIIVEVDESKRYTWSNQAGMQFFGEDLIGREASYYFEGVQETYNKVQPLFDGAEDVIHIQSWQRRKDGEKRLLSWWCKVLKNEKGLVIGALSTGRDITERYHTEEMLQEQLHFSQQLLDAIPVPIFYKDRPGMFRGCNTAYEKFVGMTKEQVVGKTVFDIAPQNLAEIYYQADEVLFTQPGTQFYETSFRHADGNMHDIIFHKATYVLDVTEHRRMEQELKKSEQRYRELSIIDDLTRLYNSRHFYFQLKIELRRSNRYEQPLTLLLLDLDNFKGFNDTYGHVQGDQVLQRLGQVVKRCLRETDFAFRYGGEEFTILLPMTTSADGAVIAERIRTEFKKETFSPAPDQDVHVTVSIGLAQYKTQEDMKAFVHRVDQLMYQGKKNGKDRVCYES